jgi:hypothetical protein
MLDMRKEKARALSAFFMKAVLVVLCACTANAAEKTEAEYFHEAHVFFDVQKRGTVLELRGEENGAEQFRFSIEDSLFDTFTEYSGFPFRVEKREEALYVRYRSEDEFFEIRVQQNGDVSLMDSPQTYTAFDRCKTYAFRTNGTLENHGQQAFYFLVTCANAFHNFGTIQAYSTRLAQFYCFNSGVMKIGELPIAVTDLRKGKYTVKRKPSYKSRVYENCGECISKAMLNIKAGIHYYELGESTLKDLQMHEGNIYIFEGTLNVAGTLKGNLGDVALIGKTSSVYVREFETLPKAIHKLNGGALYTHDDEKDKIEKLYLEQETDRMNRLGEKVYDRYARIKRGEVLTAGERKNYKDRYGDGWEENAAQQHPWPIK